MSSASLARDGDSGLAVKSINLEWGGIGSTLTTGDFGERHFDSLQIKPVALCFGKCTKPSVADRSLAVSPTWMDSSFPISASGPNFRYRFSVSDFSLYFESGLADDLCSELVSGNNAFQTHSDRDHFIKPTYGGHL
ncbi:hypothetical protein EVAR_14509_1 [Eumeta japonica]|uniref:Uncharacterized protein n=1 Tax=Eumeta variegata TaxID=151549 RepID=A0A4C1U323_EUMVA|nr:hypothetical protein EVAR_14509_1 [Eumeta japonica]